MDLASTALARLANELPQLAQQLSQKLPQMIENARQPIAELSSGLQSARDGIYAITESLPQDRRGHKRALQERQAELPVFFPAGDRL